MICILELYSEYNNNDLVHFYLIMSPLYSKINVLLKILRNNFLISAPPKIKIIKNKS